MSYKPPPPNVTLEEDFITEQEEYDLIELLESDKITWNLPFSDTRKSNCIMGDTGLIYQTGYTKYVSQRLVVPWIKIVEDIKERISKKYNQKFKVCIMQRYPNGKVGISPHRDKEMIHNTLIAGLSLKTTRTLSINEWGKLPCAQYVLPPRSCYCMHPPTNDMYYHSIDIDESISGVRYGLTFRTYEQPTSLITLPPPKKSTNTKTTKRKREISQNTISTSTSQSHSIQSTLNMFKKIKT